MKTKSSFLNRIRWTARITGTFLVAFTTLFGIGVFIDSLKDHPGVTQHPLSTIIIIGFVFWGIALAGLVLALWKEGLGGLISFIVFFIMGILHWFNPEAPNKGSAFILFAFWMIPALLYIFYWWKSGNLPEVTE